MSAHPEEAHFDDFEALIRAVKRQCENLSPEECLFVERVLNAGLEGDPAYQKLMKRFLAAIRRGAGVHRLVAQIIRKARPPVGGEPDEGNSHEDEHRHSNESGP